MLNSTYNFLSRHSLVISLLLLTAMFVAFFPSRSVNVDEQDYLHNAQLLVSGQVRQTCDGSASQYQVNDYCVSKYNLGTSLFLIPAALTAPPVGFVISFMVFAAGIVIFYKLLKLMRINPIFVFLYALFPAFVYYSRTLMSETYSATLILAVVYFLWQEQILPKLHWGVLAGLAAGLAVFVRYTNVIPIAMIFLVLYLPALFRRNLQDMLTHLFGVLLGGLPWVIIILAVNSYLYGAALRSGYYFSGEESVFIINQVPQFLLMFAGGLSLLYPLMLELPILIRTRLSLLLLPVIATVVFYAGIPNTAFEGRLLDLILGLRFLVPVMPLLIIMYAASLHKFDDNRGFKILMIVVILILIAGSALLSYQHWQFLNQ